MKRFFAWLFCLILLFNIISPLHSFSASSYVNYKFSGGSGTEEDPYLIGKLDDFEQLHNYYIENPDIRAPQKHFKLIKDFTLSRVSSYFVISDSIAPNALKETAVSLYDLSSDNENSEEVFEELIATYGRLYVIRSAYSYEKLGSPVLNVESEYLEVDNIQQIQNIVACLDSLDGRKQEILLSGETYYDFQGLYYMSGFLGVFDGNGHTITMKYSTQKQRNFLFGFIKNTAIVKNLNLKGTSFALAYELGEGCLVENCTVDADSYIGFREEQTYDSADGSITTTYYPGSVITNSYGTVRNSYNISAAAGDFNRDGIVDAKDINRAKRYLCEPDNIPSACADINMDGLFNTKDAYVLQLIVLGMDPRR